MPGTINAQNLALLRGFLEGLSPETLAARYGGGELSDGRSVRASVRTIREALSLEARRRGRAWRDIKLLWIDPDKLAAAPAGPSLEEFRDEVDPDGYYSEMELLELYQDAHNASNVSQRRNDRNQRLRRRQLAILSWLEQQVPAPAKLDDELVLWLSEPIASRLVVAEIRTIRQLLDVVRQDPVGWWYSIPRVGRVTATQIEIWLRRVQAEQGIAPVHSIVKTIQLRESASTAIAPIEYFCPPSQFAEEYSYISNWLHAQSSRMTPNAYRVRRREMERFMLFCYLELNCTVKVGAADQLEAYAFFIRQIGQTTADAWRFKSPQSAWIGPRHSERNTHAWRPFAGALQLSSRILAIDLVKSTTRKLFPAQPGLPAC